MRSFCIKTCPLARKPSGSNAQNSRSTRHDLHWLVVNSLHISLFRDFLNTHHCYFCSLNIFFPCLCFPGWQPSLLYCFSPYSRSLAVSPSSPACVYYSLLLQGYSNQRFEYVSCSSCLSMRLYNYPQMKLTSTLFQY